MANDSQVTPDPTVLKFWIGEGIKSMRTTQNPSMRPDIGSLRAAT
jgi:hypothetical protein